MARRPVSRLIPVGIATVIALTAGLAAAETAEPSACAAPLSLTLIEPALAHAAARIEQSKALTIVAVGSSSTQAVGASAPSFSYPSRLEAALKMAR